MSKVMGPQKPGGPDDYETPPEALAPLLPFLDKSWTVWEPACGRGQLVRLLRDQGFTCIASDIINCNCPQQLLRDFLVDAPLNVNFIVTNPPYSKKDLFLERCYTLRIPFALLMPLTTLETAKRQRLFIRHGLEIVLLDKRINFITPNGTKSSSAWFATAWFTWGLNIGRQLTFTHVRED